MHCHSFINLSTQQKLEFVSKLLHCVRNDETYFLIARSMINGAEGKGLFKGVEILPESFHQTINHLQNETHY